MIVGLSGYARTGKDTVGQFLVEDHNFKRLSFADALRDLAVETNPIVSKGNCPTCFLRLANVIRNIGWEKAKDRYPEVRQFLNGLGNGARDVIGEDVWARVVGQKIGEEPGDYVITDVRFPNEARMLADEAAFIVRIARPEYTAARGADGKPFYSEVALDDWEFDEYLINNGSLRYLQVKVDGLIGRLRGSA